jgi:multiple sugar transport system permease protein/raffinose/stachyose/melibiose transport system permease protein
MSRDSLPVPAKAIILFFQWRQHMLRRSQGKNTHPESGFKKGQRRFILGVSLPMIVYESIGIFTLIWAFTLMFFKYSPGRAGGPILGFGGSNPFVGLQHFQNMFTGVSLEARQFRLSLSNTLIFAFVVLALNLAITLPLAALIESISHKYKNLFRMIYFLPVLTASVGVASMWDYLYDPQAGLINAFIRIMGGKPIAWLSDPRAEFLEISVSMLAVIFAYLWADYGFNLVIFIAALQGIPDELKEAAMIDGASQWSVFTKVLIPLLRPTLLFVCVMTMLSSFQVFDVIQVMTDGGPNNQTRVMMLDIYDNAFRFQRMGWAAAVSFVLFLIVMIVTVIQMRVLRTDWEY